MFRVSQKALGLFGCVTLFFAFFAIQVFCSTGEPSVGATIFIHGTLPTARWSVERYRANAFTPFDQIVGEKNVLREYQLSGVADGVVCDDLPIAENFIIPAYHAAAQAVGVAHKTERYFTFGWSGLLSRLERRQAAEDLYGSLTALHDDIKKTTGIDPEIRIIAHSYGGEVGELLSEAEEQHRNKLHVSWLFMYGTPMHAGSVNSLLSPVFQTVVLVSSPGDRIQPLDIFSTDGHKRAQMRMADVVPDLEKFVHGHQASLGGPLARCDVHICVGDNPRHITHTNMWLLGRSRPIVKGFLDELPLVVLTPLFMKTLEKDECSRTSYRLTLKADKTACWTCLELDEHEVCSRLFGRRKRAGAKQQQILLECHDGACALYDVLHEWDLKAQAVWRPCDRSRNVVLNHKNFEIIKSFIWPW
jgi:hypothetical protein